MKLPPILTKKMAGLPTWAWLALAAGGVGVGLILRSQNSEVEDTGDPCDPESESYNPEQCNAVSDTELEKGYDSGDPCDPRSVTYEPAACMATGGIGYESAGGMAGPGGSYVEAPYEPLPSELQSAEEGGIVPDAPLVTITQNIRTAHKPCNKRTRPKAKKGYNIVCEGGRWSYEPMSRTQKRKRQKKTENITGGGAPHRRNDKTGKHGKGKKRRKRRKKQRR